MNIITSAEVRKGDKLKVTWPTLDVEKTFVGVADHLGKTSKVIVWYTEQRSMLVNDHRRDQVIELLERPKTPEEILQERRDKLVATFVGADSWIKYHNTSVALRRAVDHIIKLEDEKEALTK